MHLRWNHRLNFPQQWIKYSWWQEYTILLVVTIIIYGYCFFMQTDWMAAIGGMHYYCATTVTFSTGTGHALILRWLLQLGFPAGIPNPLYEHEDSTRSDDEYILIRQWYCSLTITQTYLTSDPAVPDVLHHHTSGAAGSKVWVIATPKVISGSHNYPACAHAQQGVVCRLWTQKIAISRDLGTWATRKHNESIELGEKLASVCFKSRDTIHECHK
jgi:hypothetical protein